MTNDEIIKDLKKLINNDSIYHIITKTDIQKIINKYDMDFRNYLESKYKLLDYNEYIFTIDISNNDIEFDVNKLINDAKNKFNKNIRLDVVGCYRNRKTYDTEKCYLYFRIEGD